MAQLKAGDKALDFTFDTIDEKGIKLSEAVKNADKTVVHFLRYYGCPTCQLDIRYYMDLIDQIKDKDAQLYVALQSKPEILKDALGDETLPFDIICDPDQAIYKLYDIGSITQEARATVDMDVMAEKRAKIQELGIVHGEYEGNEQQLPALFILDKDMNLLYAQYSVNMTDMPAPKAVVELI